MNLLMASNNETRGRFDQAYELNDQRAFKKSQRNHHDLFWCKLVKDKGKWIYLEHFDYIDGLPITGWLKKYWKQLRPKSIENEDYLRLI